MRTINLAVLCALALVACRLHAAAPTVTKNQYHALQYTLADKEAGKNDSRVRIWRADDATSSSEMWFSDDQTTPGVTLASMRHGWRLDTPDLSTTGVVYVTNDTSTTVVGDLFVNLSSTGIVWLNNGRLRFGNEGSLSPNLRGRGKPGSFGGLYFVGQVLADSGLYTGIVLQAVADSAYASLTQGNILKILNGLTTYFLIAADGTVTVPYDLGVGGDLAIDGFTTLVQTTSIGDKGDSRNLDIHAEAVYDNGVWVLDDDQGWASLHNAEGLESLESDRITPRTLGLNIMFGGDTVTGGDLVVGNDLSVGGDLTVDGFTTLTDNVAAEADLSIGGDLTVTNNASVGGDLTVDGFTTLTGLTIEGSYGDSIHWSWGSDECTLLPGGPDPESVTLNIQVPTEVEAYAQFEDMVHFMGDVSFWEDVKIFNIRYPIADGAAGQVVKTNGAGVLSIGSIGANPSATVNGTATNGTAETFIRSNGAPALADPFTPADGTQNITGSVAVSANLAAASICLDAATEKTYWLHPQNLYNTKTPGAPSFSDGFGHPIIGIDVPFTMSLNAPRFENITKIKIRWTYWSATNVYLDVAVKEQDMGTATIIVHSNSTGFHTGTAVVVDTVDISNVAYDDASTYWIWLRAGGVASTVQIEGIGIVYQ